MQAVAVPNVVHLRRDKRVFTTRTESEHWMNRREVALLTRRDVEAVKKLIQRGRIKILQSGDGRILMAIEDVREFMGIRA